MKMTETELRSAYQYAVQQQEMWYRLYLECYKYAMPNRNNFWQVPQTARKNDVYMYDSTAMLAVRAFVAKTQSSLTPPGVNWCTLKAGSFVPDQDKEKVNEWLQILGNEIFDDLRNSNFDPVIAESYYDLAAGTAALYVKEMTDDPDCPFWFESVSLYLIAAYENSKGLLTNVFRRYRYMQFYQIKTRFPYIKTWPKYIEKSIEKDPFGFFPMVDAWIDQEDGKFIHYVGNEQLNEIYFTSEPQESSPWIVFRWSKLAGETYGRGPLMDVIGDVKVCNKMMEQFIKQASLCVNPPYAYCSQYLNTNNLTLEPGAMIAVLPTAGTVEPLKPLFEPGDLQMGEWGFNKWWDNINQGLYKNPLPDNSDPTKTATEIEYTQQEYTQQVGPPVGRMQQECLNPLMKRLAYIKIRSGSLPKEVFPDNKYTRLSYQSPLVQNQKTAELKSIETFVQAMAQIAGPQASAGAMDLAKAVGKIAELTNVPLDIIKSEAELQQQTQQAQQQANEQHQAAMMQAMGNANQNQPNIPQGGSVLPANQ